MAKALITYASMSGNTEDIAGIIKDTLQEYGLDIDCIDMDDAETSALTSYDYVLIGTYTWGDGDLPYEAEDFFEEVQQLELNGLKTACFGSGDYSYPKFCEAVNLFSDMLQEAGAAVYQETLKIELAPETDDDVESCREFARGFLAWADFVNKGKSHVS
ncbi:flavodoxin [Bacillus mojavensis]|uniref:Flavodoxin n=1 Tax=Bacillus mojavensis TaxID=72360 RepID=A0ABX6LVP7_BACMO|nr:flavodoxin [Bacillus mojavensis]MDR4227472.1 flavodoxin [Bacillus mojavensis]MEC1667952.1 flavodoxin [Bacillus mojavensis]MEC3588131.1 flavodoxin [Bacillus mojavensis]MEC5243900.1 flavodoxin [Bacillus mojavensis]MED0750158.1 flavodoxin [Bacillus mojavensis]